MTVLFVQRQQFDVYTTYCLRKTAAEQCIDELGGDHNGFLQVRIAAAASLKNFGSKFSFIFCMKIFVLFLSVAAPGKSV